MRINSLFAVVRPIGVGGHARPIFLPGQVVPIGDESFLGHGKLQRSDIHVELIPGRRLDRVGHVRQSLCRLHSEARRKAVGKITFRASSHRKAKQRPIRVVTDIKQQLAQRNGVKGIRSSLWLGGRVSRRQARAERCAEPFQRANRWGMFGHTLVVRQEFDQRPQQTLVARQLPGSRPAWPQDGFG